jgi:hypothetical protein
MKKVDITVKSNLIDSNWRLIKSFEFEESVLNERLKDKNLSSFASVEIKNRLDYIKDSLDFLYLDIYYIENDQTTC